MRLLSRFHKRRIVWCTGIFLTGLCCFYVNFKKSRQLTVEYHQYERSFVHWNANENYVKNTDNVQLINNSRSSFKLQNLAASNNNSVDNQRRTTKIRNLKTLAKHALDRTTSRFNTRVLTTTDEIKVNKPIPSSHARDPPKTTADSTQDTRRLSTHLMNKNTLTTAFTTTSVQCSDPFLSTFRREKRFLRVMINYGGFGNVLFLYASSYGLAVRHNKTIITDRTCFLNTYFNLDAIQVDNCVFEVTENEVSFMIEHKASTFDERFFHLPPKENIQIGYYLQSWKYFENVVPQLKKQFVFEPTISQKAEKILRNKAAYFLKKQHRVGDTAQNVTFVGVHVRRGDILSENRFVKFGYQVAPVHYINKAMKYFTDKFNTVLFVLCSDNIKWAEANIKHRNVVFVHEAWEVDMSVLIQCNHTIMTVGTFGWWCGFLAGGITVYYKHPARNGSRLRSTFSKDYSDYFYPGWIGME